MIRGTCIAEPAGFGLGFLFRVTLAVFATGIATHALLRFAAERLGFDPAPFAQVLFSASMLAGIALGWRKLTGGERNSLLTSLRWPTRARPWLQAAGAILLVHLCDLVLLRLTLALWPEGLSAPLGNPPPEPFVVLLCTPVLEEILFRGILLAGLLRGRSFAAANVMTAVLFAWWHVQPLTFVAAFGFGLVAGWLRRVTGSLLPCIALHAACNLMLLVPSGTGSWGPWGLAGLALLLPGASLQGV